jgi:hypothetical protein
MTSPVRAKPRVTDDDADKIATVGQPVSRVLPAGQKYAIPGAF